MLHMTPTRLTIHSVCRSDMPVHYHAHFLMLAHLVQSLGLSHVHKDGDMILNWHSDLCFNTLMSIRQDPDILLADTCLTLG